MKRKLKVNLKLKLIIYKPEAEDSVLQYVLCIMRNQRCRKCFFFLPLLYFTPQIEKSETTFSHPPSIMKFDKAQNKWIFDVWWWWWWCGEGGIIRTVKCLYIVILSNCSDDPPTGWISQDQTSNVYVQEILDNIFFTKFSWKTKIKHYAMCTVYLGFEFSKSGIYALLTFCCIMFLPLLLSSQLFFK